MLFILARTFVNNFFTQPIIKIPKLVTNDLTSFKDSIPNKLRFIIIIFANISENVCEN